MFRTFHTLHRQIFRPIPNHPFAVVAACDLAVEHDLELIFGIHVLVTCISYNILLVMHVYVI
jgi:hypothetical protein